uniref:Uncharacterized protein n=1 Tax=Ditylenchus dipsaci TaxID=166011 RepID=A0A915D3Z8_9BILA
MEENLKRYAQWAPVGIAQCSILKYGPKVLGGFFYGIIGDTILLGHPFMDRQMLHDGFAARFLTEVVAKKLHPNCKNFKAFLPEHLIDPFDGFLKAVNATKDFGIREQCQRLSFSVDEKLNVGFSFKIPRSPILEELEELFALDQASQDIIKSRNPLKPTFFESLIDEPLD